MVDNKAHNNSAGPASSGPLAGLRIVEIADFGPAPFAAMMLADMGAEVIRIERPGAVRREPHWVTLRGRPAVALDLKDTEDRRIAAEFLIVADAVIEGFRPNVMERLGLGPSEMLARNPRLIYCRATGWGQDGPLAQVPGHDLNYLAITGILGALGANDRPPPVPLNILGDFAGGGMMVLAGLLAAIIERGHSGRGQVVDCAMSEGASLLAAFLHYMRAAGRWPGGRGNNLLDGGAPFYAVYECADGRYIALGAIEPAFWAEFRRRCGLDDALFEERNDRSRWPEISRNLTAMFLTKPRDEWAALLEESDCCVSPVLDWDEAPAHRHNRARSSFVDIGGVTQPAPAPRFGRTPAAASPQPTIPGDSAAILARWRSVESRGHTPNPAAL